MNLIFTGPPGSGKTTLGKICAAILGYSFVDTDQEIVQNTGQTINEIFIHKGEKEFRNLETKVLESIVKNNNQVVSLGGGTLLKETNRSIIQNYGKIICLTASNANLKSRLTKNTDSNRPLIDKDSNNNNSIDNLLQIRKKHYDSFATQISTDHLSPQELAVKIVEEIMPWNHRINTNNKDYPIVLGNSNITDLKTILQFYNIRTPNIIVTDSTVKPLWGNELSKILSIPIVSIPTGEENKTLNTVNYLYDKFLENNLDRTSIVIALGGGVIGDIVGFAAATYMRGIDWVNIPTTLLAMVDASIGGKVGIDLQQGKNMVGAFHPPKLVISDPIALETLPLNKYKSGLSEIIKHGIIANEELFNKLNPELLPLSRKFIQDALEVKIDIIEQDPFERNVRAKLNLGHTVGHGIEAASNYEIGHGDAIAIGLYAESLISEKVGLAKNPLSQTIKNKLLAFNLPIKCNNISPKMIRTLMESDKKKQHGKLLFTLPTNIGEVKYGIQVEEKIINTVIKQITD